MLANLATILSNLSEGTIIVPSKKLLFGKLSSCISSTDTGDLPTLLNSYKI